MQIRKYKSRYDFFPGWSSTVILVTLASIPAVMYFSKKFKDELEELDKEKTRRKNRLSIPGNQPGTFVPGPNTMNNNNNYYNNYNNNNPQGVNYNNNPHQNNYNLDGGVHSGVTAGPGVVVGNPVLLLMLLLLLLLILLLLLLLLILFSCAWKLTLNSISLGICLHRHTLLHSIASVNSAT